MDRVARYAVSNNRRHAKFAARLLAHATEGHSACEDVISVRELSHFRFPTQVAQTPLND
jgi:hypothetical protein